ncbi:hypothetical protein AS156_33570 [Bradyrhizobium macuxiense]|uniref:O-antigen ligase-like membrane protein n=1 Tax=Bradyrhizobium macuxiense TaxID=1755647 RepID=A0A109K0H6_9BRAD|nr:hypothetical protein [Bradyrhizobium macuxiense]KWV58524.1 hypothetical protein AS156_33570 [Bradyrhizobium macuxiense]
MAAPAAAVRSQPASSGTELSKSGRRAVWASIISVLFLSQIAYNINTFPASTDLLCYAAVTAYLLISGFASIEFVSLALFFVALVFACFGTVTATSSTSWTSLMLLFVLYAPFSIRLKGAPEEVHEYILSAYVSAATVIACIALVQIVLVNATKSTMLTNIYFNLPEAIRGAGHYTFLREGGGIIKPNGFFLRESADLSLIVALALIIEFGSKARLRTMGILAAGLLCSLSGSGLLAITAGFLLPRSVLRIPLFIVYLVGLVLALYLLYSLDIPGLDLWFDRLSEFSTPNTSAYARFVAPMQMIGHSFDNGPLATWFGNGAGSYLRDVQLYHMDYEVNDPTWAKLIYEYGIFGFVLIFAILLQRLYSSRLRVEICNFLLFSWISIGVVLKPSFALIVWLLTLVSAQRPAGRVKS